MKRAAATTLVLIGVAACSWTPAVVDRAENAPRLPAAATATIIAADAVPAGAILLGRVTIPDWQGRASEDGCKLEARESARRRLGATLVVIVPTQEAAFAGAIVTKCVGVGYTTLR